MTLTEWFMAFVILVVVSLLCLAPFVKFSEIGKGEHTGYVTAVDQRGYIFRNYDVYFKTDSSSSQEDVYCVNRKYPEFAENLRVVSQLGQKITISYEGVRGIGLGLCGHTEIASYSAGL